MRAALALIALCTGCTDLKGSTTGELGNLELERNAPGSSAIGDECFIACAVDRPLMTGTVEDLDVVTHHPPLLHSGSTDESVLTVADSRYTCCDGSCTEGDHYDDCLARGGEASYQVSFVVTAVARGAAKLELFDEQDTLIDRFPLEVADPSTLDVQLRDDSTYDFTTVDQLALQGQHRSIRVVARDRDDRSLFAAKGISMSIPDMNIAAFYGDKTAIDNAYGELWPLARGTDTLTAHAGDVDSSVTVISN